MDQRPLKGHHIGRGLSRGGGHDVCVSDGSPEVTMRPLFSRAQGESIRQLVPLRGGLLEGGSESGGA